MESTGFDTGGRQGDRRCLILLGLAVAVGAGLRLAHLGGPSLWTDEVLTATNTGLPWLQVVEKALTWNNSPPLYYLLVEAFVRMFGTSEAVLRLPSALAGLAAIPVLAALVRRVTGRAGAGVWAAWLLAVNPLHLWFSHEARAYALLFVFVTATLLAYRRAVSSGRAGDWGLVLAGWLAASLTHSTGLIALPVVGVWWLLERSSWPSWKPLLCVAACFLAMILPLMSVIHLHAVSFPPDRALTGFELPYTAYTYLAGFSFGPSVRDIQQAGLGVIRPNAPAVGVVACVLAAALGAVRMARPRGALRLLALATLPALFCVVLSLTTPFPYNVRYTLPGLAGALGVLAATLDGRPRLAPWLGGGVLALSLFADAQWFTRARYANEDSRGAIDWMVRHSEPGARILVAPLYAEIPTGYYNERRSSPLHIVGLPIGEPWPDDEEVDGFMLTRKYHVPNLDDLLGDLRARHGDHLVYGTVPGYELWVWPDAGPSAREGGPSPLPAPP